MCDTNDATPDPKVGNLEQKVTRWLETPQVRGKPSCPCGFVGGARNIRNHRMSCYVWDFYATSREDTPNPGTQP